MRALLRSLPKASLILGFASLLYHKLVPIIYPDANISSRACSAIASTISSQSNVFYPGKLKHSEEFGHHLTTLKARRCMKRIFITGRRQVARNLYVRSNQELWRMSAKSCALPSSFLKLSDPSIPAENRRPDARSIRRTIVFLCRLAERLRGP